MFSELRALVHWRYCPDDGNQKGHHLSDKTPDLLAFFFVLIVIQPFLKRKRSASEYT